MIPTSSTLKDGTLAQVEAGMTTEKLTIRPYQKQDQYPVVELWQECSLIAPQNDPVRDIERKLETNAEMFLVGLVGGVIVATVMAGYEGHRGWINYLAVAPQVQRNGIGQRMMAEAENLLRGMGCPKINLQIRSSNTEVIRFYETIGYSVDPVISLGKRLFEDSRERNR